MSSRENAKVHGIVWEIHYFWGFFNFRLIVRDNIINKTQNMFLVYAKNCIILRAFAISAQRQRYFKDCAILNVISGLDQSKLDRSNFTRNLLTTNFIILLHYTF